MKGPLRAHTLRRLLLAKDDLVARMRCGIPAAWPGQVAEFLTTVQSLDGVPVAAALTVFIEISQDMERLAGIPLGIAPSTSFAVLDDPVPDDLSTAILCERFEASLRDWFIRIRPGRLVPAVQARRVATYIDGHFTDRITLQRLTDLSGWDGRLLARMFEAEEGLTIRAYVERRRLEDAAKRLRRGEKVESVLANVGWRGRKNFFRAFRRRFAVTPAQYRGSWVDSTGTDEECLVHSDPAVRRADDEQYVPVLSDSVLFVETAPRARADRGISR